MFSTLADQEKHLLLSRSANAIGAFIGSRHQMQLKPLMQLILCRNWPAICLESLKNITRVLRFYLSGAEGRPERNIKGISDKHLSGG